MTTEPTMGEAGPTAPANSLARQWWPYLFTLFVAGLVCSALVPPFQAPDEFDHVRRAYLLGEGDLLLHSVDGAPSGGYIDRSLDDYMIHFTSLPHHPERRLGDDARTAAETVRWSRDAPRFEPAFATAYYFPALYVPQALGFTIGKAFGLPVGQSYRLARLLALLSALAILMAAFRVYAPPPLAAAFLALPMSLFLISSAALDGIATAMAVLALSSFARIVSDQNAIPRWCFPMLLVTVALISACRANLLPMFMLPLVAAWWSPRRAPRVVATMIVAGLVMAWTLYTIKTTVYPAGPRDVDRAARLTHFVLHPADFVHSLFVTIADAGRTGFYAQSFIGVLGWLDTFLPRPAYRALLLLLVALTACTYARAAGHRAALARWSLIFCAFAAALMTFLALLVQWVPADTEVITGIQGRYFTVPALMLAYALAIAPVPSTSERHRYAKVFVALLVVVSASVTVDTLLRRYHMPPDPSDMPYRMPPS